MAWTSPQDVIDRWVGENPPAVDGVVVKLIGDAETILRSAYLDIETRLASGELTIDQVVLVVSRMVTRVLRNPDGTRQVTETTGPFSRNRTFAGDSPGSLWLTDEDRAMLGDLTGRQRAFTVTTAPGTEPVDWFADDVG